ncbi:putative RDD family membrane protein YckC [Nocardiopsis sp. Huas11]|uniref:RDD family protein n=1 Tax=Nocardiopsis sp. Huas11 TaxID=2183912 RepID=UPI000EAC9CA6|nr:RDD family protein [Nocardiopsis sp. Huas11]RKS10848.1 putative RDD family membrane protein YckC [Nocardiopsis sp. Huas11]
MSSPHWNPPQRSTHSTGGWEMAPYPHGAEPTTPPGWVPPAAAPAPAPEEASFGRRLAARTIDYVLAGITAVAFFMAMMVVTVAINGSTDSTDGEIALWSLLWVFGWGLLLFFYDWLYLVTWGRTLGKLMLGIKVVSAADGGRLSQGQAVGRSALFCLPQTLPVAGHLFSLGESMAALGTGGRSVHDRAAGTKVVRVR